MDTDSFPGKAVLEALEERVSGNTLYPNEMGGGDGQPKSWGCCVRCRSKCSNRSVVVLPHQDGQVRAVQEA